MVCRRGPDGLDFELVPNAALGHARYVLNKAEKNHRQPVWTPDRSLALVADARLYNRAELLQTLNPVPSASDSPSDAEILLAAYLRWGREMVDRLRGDFAFAFWDIRERSLFAARDPFGAKPFFFHTDAEGLRFGSEPKQLLLLPGVDAEPHEGVIADYLIHAGHRAFEHTFYEHVKRLRAGHVLIADRQSLRQYRYWPARTPPADFAGSPSECAERFYVLFRDSVRQRLETESRCAMELSGGYDSSSVVTAAADVLQARIPALRAPIVVTYTYPGLDCDESAYSDAVIAATGLEQIRVEAPMQGSVLGLLNDLYKVDAPIPEMNWLLRRKAAMQLTHHECKVMLTGLGGDDLVWDPPYELDFLRAGLYLDAVRHCLGECIARPKPAWQCLRGLIGHLLPEEFKRRLRRPENFPPWIDSALLERTRRDLEDGPAVSASYSDLSRQTLSGWLTAPGMLYVIESLECLWAYAGIELRHPFLCRDLADFVLSIPYETRQRLPGRFKRLLIQAMSGRLPAHVRDRGFKTGFDSYFVGLLVRSWPQLVAAVPDETDAVSRAYTHLARATMQSSQPTGDLKWFGGARRFWQPMFLEMWLRDIGCRHKSA